MKNKIRHLVATGIITAALVSTTSMVFVTEAVPSDKKVHFNSTVLLIVLSSNHK